MNDKETVKIYIPLLRAVISLIFLLSIFGIGLIWTIYNFNLAVFLFFLTGTLSGLWSLFITIKNKRTPILTMNHEGLFAYELSKYGIIPWNEIKSIEYETSEVVGRATRYFLYIDVFNPEKFITDNQKNFNQKHPGISNLYKSFKEVGNKADFIIQISAIDDSDKVAEQVIDMWKEYRGKLLLESKLNNLYTCYSKKFNLK